MRDIDSVQLRRLDLGQLLVFAGIMKHRRLTVVASELGLTQSAISHTLKRLRDTFDDELFLRRPNGVEPTARAEALEWRVLEILRLTHEALNADQDFDPQTANRTVRINAPDYEVAVFTPKILDVLSTDAPGIKVSFQSMTRAAAMAALGDGSLDCAVGFIHRPGDQFEQVKLFDENYRVVMRKDHPLAGETLTLDSYCSARHLLVSAKGDFSGIVDESLAAVDRQRHVAASVPQFLSAMANVEKTDMVATLPARLAEAYAESFGLVHFAPPVEIRPFPVSLTWHRRTSSDLALSWFRQKMQDVITPTP